jgi:hypothetical protein
VASRPSILEYRDKDQKTALSPEMSMLLRYFLVVKLTMAAHPDQAAKVRKENATNA